MLDPNFTLKEIYVTRLNVSQYKTIAANWNIDGFS